MNKPSMPGGDFPRPDDFRVPDFTKPIDPVPGDIGSGPAWQPADKPIRAGYVLEYQLELHNPMLAAARFPIVDDSPFFRFTLVDAPDAAANPEEYLLLRTHTAVTMDRVANGDPLTVTYGNVEQAIVATVKDALLHSKKVTVGWEPEMKGTNPTGRRIVGFVRLSR